MAGKIRVLRLSSERRIIFCEPHNRYSRHWRSAPCSKVRPPHRQLFTASIGNAFGGDAPSKKTTWALAIGGGGAHGIGSELEFSETRNFFETPNGVAHGKIITLIPSIFVAVPVNRVRPYGIFGFGFIRQRTEQTTGGILADLSDDDIGYSIGGGVTFQFARHAGVQSRPAAFQSPNGERPELSAISGRGRAGRIEVREPRA